MGWEIDKEFGRDIQELIKKMAEGERELQQIRSWQREFSAIHARFNSLYGSRFGINQRFVLRRLAWPELERRMHLVRAENAQPQKTGLLGLGGLKRREYDTLTERLNLIESNLTILQEEKEAYLAEKEQEVRILFDACEQSYQDVWGAYREICSRDSYEPAQTVETAPLLMGEVAVLLSDCEYLTSRFARQAYSFLDANIMYLPLRLSMTALSPCCVFYENEKQLERIYAWLQALNRQMLCRIPAFHYSLLYLDGLHNGKGLRELLPLQSVYETYIPEIAQPLQENAMRLLQVKREGDSIRQALKELERYMGTVTDMLQGCGTFAEYNRSHAEKIPYLFVVMECLEACADNALVHKVLCNGSQCGIFVLYIQDMRQKKEHSELRRVDIFENVTQLIFSEENITFRQESTVFPCRLLTAPMNATSFVHSVQEKCNIRREMDNRFETYFPDTYQWGTRTSVTRLCNGNVEGKIVIPCVLDERGNIVSIELGSADFAHGLISGTTGCGKSTLLHMIIYSVVMHYHPKDVEIWLADYKQAEMAVYIAACPPHIRFIGLERNEEFSFNLIDLLYDEYEKRMRMFVEAEVRNIDDYKEKYGIHSLARILLIIDEFHLMSQQVRENPAYAEKLENILSEARAAGIVCLFADQAVSVGLRGLTEKGKKQMRMRLAMASDREEMSVVLDTKVTESEAVLQRGEVIQKRFVSRNNAENDNVREVVLERYRVINLSNGCRKCLTEKANAIYGRGEPPVIIDGKRQVCIDWEAARAYEKHVADKREAYYLHLGKPSDFTLCYAIPLRRTYGQNLLCIHENYDLQGMVLLHAALSFLRTGKRELYILADQNDGLYLAVKNELHTLQKRYPQMTVASDMGEVCTCISQLHNSMMHRRKESDEPTALIIWMGLDSMMQVFGHYGTFPDVRKPFTVLPSDRIEKEKQDLEQKMTSLFVTKTDAEAAERYEGAGKAADDVLYNAAQDVCDLIWEGPKWGMFQFVFMGSILALQSVKVLKTGQFTYKMSGYMNRDDSLAFYGTSSFTRSMSSKRDAISFVCYDGKKARFFVPYLWK